jgi:hypothetical protein
MGLFGVVRQITPSCRNECICVAAVTQIAQAFPGSAQALAPGSIGENFRNRVDALVVERQWLESVEPEVLLIRAHQSPEHGYERSALQQH